MKKVGQPSIFPPSRPVEILAVHVKPCNFHALIMNNFKHRVLRIEPNNTGVQKCASRSTEFAS